MAKDAIKERLYDEVGIGDRAWSQRLGRGTFAVMFHWLAEELRVGRSAIVEANFSEEALPAFAALPPHRTLQVYCTAPRDVLLERYTQRPRHPGHVDDVVLDELRSGVHDDRHPRLPLGGEVLDVDSSKPVDVPAVVERVRAALGST